MVAPTSYQGGKHRIADAILDHIHLPPGGVFCDLCCGSGAVSLALMKRGFAPRNIIMVDNGPYGDFWRAVAGGAFDLGRLDRHLRQMPSDPRAIRAYLKQLSREPINDDSVYVFLLLQAGSFGGKAIGQKGGRWTNTSFRAFWEPKPGCNRKSHVNPMMPMPGTLRERVAEIVSNCAGLRAFRADVRTFSIPDNAVVYIDPPYEGTAAYAQHTLDIRAFVQGLTVPCYVSEVVPLTEDALLISNGRSKGGISGKRRSAHQEWLSRFNVEGPWHVR